MSPNTSLRTPAEPIPNKAWPEIRRSVRKKWASHFCPAAYGVTQYQKETTAHVVCSTQRSSMQAGPGELPSPTDLVSEPAPPPPEDDDELGSFFRRNLSSITLSMTRKEVLQKVSAAFLQDFFYFLLASLSAAKQVLRKMFEGFGDEVKGCKGHKLLMFEQFQCR